MLHGRGSIRFHGFDIAVLSDGNIRVPQDSLDCFVSHPELVKIRGQPASESVPAVPLQLYSVKNRHDNVSHECIKIDRFPPVRWETSNHLPGFVRESGASPVSRPVV